MQNGIGEDTERKTHHDRWVGNRFRVTDTFLRELYYTWWRVAVLGKVQPLLMTLATQSRVFS